MTTVAVIQPYFVPYAGYFRLFTATDTVVMFDCVQFPRRGWVHRNRFETSTGELAWLTLPLEKAARDVRIADLRFVPDAPERLGAQMHRFPQLDRAKRSQHPLIDGVLHLGGPSVSDYLVRLIAKIVALLGMERPIVRSSALDLPAELHGEARVIAAVNAVGGHRYVNPSGGRELYRQESFAAAGLELGFLDPYGGSYASVLARLLEEVPADVAGEIRRETVVSP